MILENGLYLINLNKYVYCTFKVWEVKFSRSGEFEKMTRAFELTGHTSGIYHFDFNASSSHAATLSKVGNNVFRLWLKISDIFFCHVFRMHFMHF